MSGKLECPNICEGTIIVDRPFLPLSPFLMAKMGRRGEALASSVPTALNMATNMSRYLSTLWETFQQYILYKHATEKSFK